MPRLLGLMACEKVIVDLNTKIPSLIGIFQRMNVQVQENVPIPENALSPVRWYVFALWQFHPSEVNKNFVQQLRITAPNGSIFSGTASHFKTIDPNELQARNVVEIFGLPVFKEGVATIRVWLEGMESAAAEYPFFIAHQKVPNVTTPAEEQ